MGTIIGGIVLGLLIFGLVFLYMMLSENPNIQTCGCGVLLAIVIAILGISVGIFRPLSGYEEPQIDSTTKLVSLRDETISEGSGLFYISISGNNSYTYYVEVDSPYASDSQKAYKSNTISSNNVTIIEDDSYTDAKLITYVKYGKKSFWTFAVDCKEYEYVFYVPTGTIVRDVSLG